MARIPPPDTLEFFQSALDHMDAFAVIDREGNYVYVNAVWCQLMRAESSRVVGRHVTEFCPETRAMDAMEKNLPVLAHAVNVNTPPERLRQVVNYMPIRRDGEVVGCAIYTIFNTPEAAVSFADVLAKPSLENGSRKSGTPRP